MDGVALSCMTSVGIHFDEAVVSARLLPVVCPFCSCSLVFHVSPFLSDWLCLVVLSSYGWLADLPQWGRCGSVLRGYHRISLLLGRGFGSHDAL